MKPQDLRPPLPLALVLVAAAAGLSPGCRAVNTVSTSKPGVNPNAVDVSYKVNNLGLSWDVKVLSAYEEVRNGLIHAQVNIRNEGAGEKWFMWQVVWFNRAGMQIPIEPVVWERQVIAERQESTIEFMAPSREAYDWRLTIRQWDTR